MKQFLFIFSSIILLSSCFGDKKSIIGEDLNDESFVNTNFKVNLINYSEGMSACDQITASEIANLYGVNASLIHIEDPTKSDRYKKDMLPACMLYIKTGENDFEWPRGSISILPEISKDEYMGDVAEAVGQGKNWVEAWSLKKSMSKSAEWLNGIGQAALWTGKKNQLEIKFEGYTLVVTPLKNISNKQELAANRDYKQIAIKMAQAAGFIN